MTAAADAARSIAQHMTEMARLSDGPVVFVTGNAMDPALRSFAEAEAVFQSDDPERSSWEELTETLEKLLEEEHVYLGSPDYDNSLYVVDLTRYEHAENPQAATLSGEWRLYNAGVIAH